jgi:hypothetical protein
MATNLVDVGGVSLASGQSLAPQQLGAGATNGAAVDTGAAQPSLSFLLNVGAVAGTNPTLNVKVQEAIEDPANPGNPLASDWSDVAGATFAQQTTAAGDLWLRVGNNVKRFVRMVATVGGSATPTFFVSGQVIAQKRITGAGGGSSVSPQT